MTKKYTISIASEDCLGDGLCCEHAGATFRISEAGISTVIDPAGDALSQILAAAYDCRMECIAVRDAASGDCVWPATLSQEEIDRLEECRAVTLDHGVWALWRDHGGGD